MGKIVHHTKAEQAKIHACIDHFVEQERERLKNEQQVKEE